MHGKKITMIESKQPTKQLATIRILVSFEMKLNFYCGKCCTLDLLESLFHLLLMGLVQQRRTVQIAENTPTPVSV